MILEVDSLSFAYGQRDVLQNVSFSAFSGNLVAVLGPNGVGKSTLFRCILGMLKPRTGKIRVDGRDISSMSRHELSGCMAYIPQSSAPVFDYTVLDTVLMGTTGALPLLSSPKEAQKQAALEALEALGIFHLRERSICRISGGERQLALIARALVQQAKLLVMDEPTANLDYGNQNRVMERIRSLAEQGYLILLSTHNPEHALLFSNQVMALAQGRLAAFGATETTLTPELLGSLYGMRVAICTQTVEERRFRLCVPLRSDREASK